MSEDELRALIRRVINDVTTRPPRRALVVFTGALLGFDEAIESLRELMAAEVQLEYVKSPSAKHILDAKVLTSVGMRHLGDDPIADHDMLILPTLTSNTAAKIAHGIADDMVSNLAMNFLQTPRPVVASRSPVCPDGPKKQWYPDIPAGYAEMLRKNLQTLESFGVHVVDSSQLCSAALAALEAREC